MDISILIINYNTRELLQQLLLSIRKNVRDVSFEIIVVDNNSMDGSRELLARDFKEVSLIKNDANVGTSKANNQAAKIATGKYLLLLNSDTIICENALERMYAFLEKEKAAAAVGCKLLNPDDSLQRSCGIFPSLTTEFYGRSFLSRLFPNSKRFNAFKLGSWDYSSRSEVDWATSACLLVRKEVFDEIDGFDENIYMYYDETDFCLRIRQLGWKIYFIPDAVVYHILGGTWQSNREIPIFHNCRSALYFFRKHHKKWETPILKLLLYSEMLLNYCFFLPLLFLKGEAMSEITARFRGYSTCLRYLNSDSFKKGTNSNYN